MMEIIETWLKMCIAFFGLYIGIKIVSPIVTYLVISLEENTSFFGDGYLLYLFMFFIWIIIYYLIVKRSPLNNKK